MDTAQNNNIAEHVSRRIAGGRRTGPLGCEMSVVVPVFNEEESLRPLDAEIRAALLAPAARPRSSMSTIARATARWPCLGTVCGLRRSEIRTRVVRFRRNYGQTAAMTAGFELAEGDRGLSAGCRRPEQSGRYPAAAGGAREGLRRGQRLAQEPPGQGHLAKIAESSRQPADRSGSPASGCTTTAAR